MKQNVDTPPLPNPDSSGFPPLTCARHLGSDVADLYLELLELLLHVVVLLGHLLILLLPGITLDFESLNLALEVAGLDIGLAETMRRGKELLAMRIE